MGAWNVCCCVGFGRPHCDKPEPGIAGEGIAVQGIAGQGIAVQGIVVQGIVGEGIAGQGIVVQGIAVQGIAGQGIVGEERRVFSLQSDGRLFQTCRMSANMKFWCELRVLLQIHNSFVEYSIQIQMIYTGIT